MIAALHRRTTKPLPYAGAIGAGVVSGALALSALGGCTDHRADARKMIGALTTARDEVCACQALPCAEAAEQRLADYLLLHVDSFKKIPRPAPGAAADTLANEAARLDGELRACLQHLAEAARPS